MKGIVLFMLFFNAVFTESAKPRSVNVALETVLEFDNKDNSGDVHFIDKIQNFLDRIKTAITKNQANIKSRRKNDENEMKFTDFIEKMAKLLKSYEDDDLQDVFVYLFDELKQRHTKSRNNEIINGSMRRFITYKLREIDDTTADNIRKILDSLLFSVRNKFASQSQKKLVKFINSIYTKETMKKFEKTLHNLQMYKSKSKRTNLELNKIIKDGVRYIFFDHYANLSNDSRRDLKIKIESFWKDWIRSNSNHYRVSSKQNIAFNDAAINLKIYSETKSLRARKTTKNIETELTTPDRDMSDTKSAVEDEEITSNDVTKSHKATKIKSKAEMQKKKHSKRKITTKKSRIQTLWQESIGKEDNRFIQNNSKLVTRKSHKKYREFTTKKYTKNTKKRTNNRSVQSSESRNEAQDVSRKGKTRIYHGEQSSKYPIPWQSRKSFYAHSSVEEGLSIESFEIDSKSVTKSYRKKLNVIYHDIEKLNDTFSSANAEMQPGYVKYKKQRASEKKRSLKKKIKDTKELSVENENDEVNYEPLKFWQEPIGAHKRVTSNEIPPTTIKGHRSQRYDNISSTIETTYTKNSITKLNNHHNELKKVNDKVGELLKSLMDTTQHDVRKPVGFNFEVKTDNVIESDANNSDNLGDKINHGQLESLFTEKKKDINFEQNPENMEAFTTKAQDLSETYLEKQKNNELNSEKMEIDIYDDTRRIKNVNSKENSVNEQLYARDKSLDNDGKDLDYKREKEIESEKKSTKEITKTTTVSHEIFISDLNEFLNSSNTIYNTHKTLKKTTQLDVKLQATTTAKTTMTNKDSISKTVEEKQHSNKTIENTIKKEDKDKHSKIESLTRNKRENATIKRRKKKTRRNNNLNKKKPVVVKDFSDTEDIKREESVKNLENQLKNIIDIQEDGEELMKTKSVVTPLISSQNPVIFIQKFFSKTDSPHITNRDKIQRAHRRILDEIQNILDPTRPTSSTTPIALFDDELKDLDDAIELL